MMETINISNINGLQAKRKGHLNRVKINIL